MLQYTNLRFYQVENISIDVVIKALMVKYKVSIQSLKWRYQSTVDHCYSSITTKPSLN